MKSSKQLSRKHSFLLCCGLFLLIVVILGVVTGSGGVAVQPSAPAATEAPTLTPTEAPTESPLHMIEGVKVLPQTDLRAGCETYACTMLLQTLGYDIDEFIFSEQYLITAPISYDENGTRYGPDMYSAMAGTVDNGYGIFAPAMAKSMNKYLDTTASGKKAYPLEGVPLEKLVEDYVSKKIPVMVWATTWMMEPYDKASWVVDYVDENARYKLGDTFTWKQNEHCLVLIGYDDEEYYFADSCEGGVSHFKKDLCQQRYEEIGYMAIVVK
jgi:uncharacterized protein YvpB